MKKYLQDSYEYNALHLANFIHTFKLIFYCLLYETLWDLFLCHFIPPADLIFPLCSYNTI